MKRSLKNNLPYRILFLFMVACAPKTANDHTEEYTCPMHLEVNHTEPGQCPICGMDLVIRKKQGKKVKVTNNLRSLLKPANAVVVSSIRTVSPVKKILDIKIEARGVIIHNTEKLGAIAAKVSGRIERLFIRSAFQPVTKGQKIMELYSAELVTAQQEFLFILKSDPDNVILIKNAREKLLALGLSANQIDTLMRIKIASPTIAVYSPWDGYIAKHEESSQERDPSMPDQNVKITEGMYVIKGQEVFTVVSHKDLWAEFDVYQHDVAAIKLNDPATVKVDNSYGSMKATVDRIQPHFDAGQGLLKVRMRLINPHHQYHSGQQVTAIFMSKTDSLEWIPVTASLNEGLNTLVFLKRKGAFHPVKISAGVRSGAWLEVRGGLEQHDSIAYNASFLVDSEDFNKTDLK